MLNPSGGDTAVAYAEANGGAIGAGGAGASATAIDGSIVDVHVDGGHDRDRRARCSVTATSHAAPKAHDGGDRGGGVGASVGVAEQTAIANGSTRAAVTQRAEGSATARCCRGATPVEVKAWRRWPPHVEGQAFGGALGGAANAVVSTVEGRAERAGNSSVVAELGAAQR